MLHNYLIWSTFNIWSFLASLVTDCGCSGGWRAHYYIPCSCPEQPSFFSLSVRVYLCMCVCLNIILVQSTSYFSFFTYYLFLLNPIPMVVVYCLLWSLWRNQASLTVAEAPRRVGFLSKLVQADLHMHIPLQVQPSPIAIFLLWLIFLFRAWLTWALK